jgi:hypothetical protein
MVLRVHGWANVRTLVALVALVLVTGAIVSGFDRCSQEARVSVPDGCDNGSSKWWVVTVTLKRVSFSYRLRRKCLPHR